MFDGFMKNKSFYPRWIVARLDAFIGRATMKGIDLENIDKKISGAKRFSLVSLFFDKETRGSVVRLFPIFFSVYLIPHAHYAYYLFVTLVKWFFFKETIWVHNVAPWKRKVVQKYFRGKIVRFIPKAYSPFFIDRAIRYSRCRRFVIWGVGESPDFVRYAIANNIQITRVEDGFFGLAGFGVKRMLPYSLVFDDKGMYFDSSVPSSLENILSSYDFSEDSILLERASFCIRKINEFGLSKYNLAHSTSYNAKKSADGKRRILVLGQVEDGMSVLYGSARIKTNAALVEIALQENPDAEIFYRPHPDHYAKRRSEPSNVDALLTKIAYVIPPSVSLQDSFLYVDRVYTMTSLAGFEALMRGIPVTVFGAPFYSGWGLTDDRQSLARRKRTLSLQEVFAGAYLLYATYRDPETGISMELEGVIDKIVEQMKTAPFVAELEGRSFIDRSYVNLNTRRLVRGRSFASEESTSVALIADSLNVMKDAIELSQSGKNVSVFFVREALVNDPKLKVPPWLKDKISIYSFTKRYGTAFSRVEHSAVKIGLKITEVFELNLRKFNSKNVGCGQLSAGLEDFVYADCLRFSAVREILFEHDLLVMCCDLNKVTTSVFYASVFYAKMLGRESSVYFVENSADFFNSLDALEKAAIDESGDYENLRRDFGLLLDQIIGFFRGINSEEESRYGVICGSVRGGNYAYSPTAFHMINFLSKKFPRLKLLYLPSAQSGLSAFEEDKGQIFDGCISANVAVYSLRTKHYNSLLGEKLKRLKVMAENIIGLVIKEQLDPVLPRLVIEGLAPRFRNFSETFVANLLFAADMSVRADNMLFFGTSMDRSPWSRIVNAIAQSRAIPTFGLQPQIMSTSNRYKAPVVDRYGAIDSAQVEVIRRLGRENGVETVGSVNLLARLQNIATFMKERAREGNSRKTIIFMMQHSNGQQMLMIASSLANACRERGYRLIVKPHPHQERQILDQVREMVGDLEFAEVLEPSDNTYMALARSDIVVGLYSSTLYEAALSGFDVVIANFGQPLDESIDFSRFGIAVKVTEASEFDAVVKDIAEGGEIARSLAQRRVEYVARNPQYKPPFDFSSIDNFIYSSVSDSVAACEVV